MISFLNSELGVDVTVQLVTEKVAADVESDTVVDTNGEVVD